MASRLKAELQVLHVVTKGEARPFPDDRLVTLRQMTADVGGEWNEVLGEDPAQALMSFARRNHVTQIVVGSTGRSRFGELVGGGSIAQKLSRLAAPAAIDVHVIARRQDPPVYSSTAEAADES
jgi:two-component system sensor histidine kinase KdpD